RRRARPASPASSRQETRAGRLSCGRSDANFVATIRLTATLVGITHADVEPRPRYQWDEQKRKINFAKHRIDFSKVASFDWSSAYVEIDDRENYGDLREIAWGFIDENLYVLVFTRRDDDEDEVIWVISLRKAQKRDVHKYVEATGFDLA